MSAGRAYDNDSNVRSTLDVLDAARLLIGDGHDRPAPEQPATDALPDASSPNPPDV
jgi:hypothetical protein